LALYIGTTTTPLTNLPKQVVFAVFAEDVGADVQGVGLLVWLVG
jgi:hypothetical protein